MWKVSFHTRSFMVHHGLDVYQSAKKIAEFGYEAIEICRPHLNQLLEDLTSAADRKVFREKVAGFGLEIAAISGHASVCHGDAEKRQIEIESYKRALDFASDVGAPIVNTFCKWLSPDIETFGASAWGARISLLERALLLERGEPEQHQQLITDVLGELADYAESRGVWVGVEDLDPTPSAFWANLIRAINSPGLWMNMQCLYGATPAETLRTRGDVVKHFHLLPPQESYGFSGWSRGEYIDFINALQEVGYQGYFQIEEHSTLDPEVTCPQILDYFRRLGV